MMIPFTIKDPVSQESYLIVFPHDSFKNVELVIPPVLFSYNQIQETFAIL